ncbi:hypothetical protein [Krasilnikovia sp. MM14-A1259]|uniref:hypothetical protein n=1 Tax=Krasilnikovia sp. MM14-A1259 TaxID=3373539 RepID=UPI003828C51F
MSKERARRRAARLAAAEKQKAARARRVARRQRRQAVLRSLTPRRRSAGRLHRRSRAERTGILLVPLVAAVAVWVLVPGIALRVVLTVLIVLVLPALVVLVLGRRS